MKVKQSITKFISCILAVCILMSAIAVMPAAASGTDMTITLQKNSYGDWNQAFCDGIGYWGFFHRKLQQHIAEIYHNVDYEVTIYIDGSNENESVGRADLFLNVGSYNYIWEVKPASHWYNKYLKEKAEDQLEKYVKAYDDQNVRGDLSIEDGEYTLFTPYGVKYTITYQNAGNGLIFYRFDRVDHIDRNDDAKGKIPIIVPKNDNNSNNGSNTGHAGGKVIEFPVPNDEKNDWQIPAAAVSVTIGGATVYLTAPYARELAIKLAAKIAANPIYNNKETSLQTVGLTSRSFLIMAGVIPNSYGDYSNTATSDDIAEFLEYLQYISSTEDLGGLFDDNELQELLDQLGEGVADDMEDASKMHVRVDPLVLDLDGNGFAPTTAKNGVHFDLDCDEMAEKISWIQGDDALLAYDRNENGMIDNGSELFGDSYILKNGEKANYGFEALADFDSNNDKIIDKNDEDFSRLLIWRDLNHDGISDEGELSTLADMKIKAIHLNYESLNATTESGTILGNVSKFVYDNDREYEIGEYWVLSQKFNTVDKNPITIPDEIAKLPNVNSMGNAFSLHKAMTLDTTGRLVNLVNDFSESDDVDERMDYVDQILLILTGAENIVPGSRGLNIDAQKLAALECLMGQRFVGQDGENPNSVAAPILISAYEKLANMYYCELVSQTTLSELIPLISVESKDDVVLIDLGLFNCVLEYKILLSDNPNGLLQDAAKYIKYLKDSGIDGFDSFRDYFSYLNDDSARLIDIAAGIAVVGTNENDLLFAAGDKNHLYGLDGDDTLYGSSGNDILDGGLGNNRLIGGAGRDMYVFKSNYGENVINDSDNNSVLRFFGDIKPEDLRMRPNEKDLIITFTNCSGKIVVENYFCHSQNSDAYTKYYKFDHFEFFDGTVWDAEEIEKHINIKMGAFGVDFLAETYENPEKWNDVLPMFYPGSEISSDKNGTKNAVTLVDNSNFIGTQDKNLFSGVWKNNESLPGTVFMDRFNTGYITEYLNSLKKDSPILSACTSGDETIIFGGWNGKTINLPAAENAAKLKISGGCVSLNGRYDNLTEVKIDCSGSTQLIGDFPNLKYINVTSWTNVNLAGNFPALKGIIMPGGQLLLGTDSVGFNVDNAAIVNENGDITVYTAKNVTLNNSSVVTNSKIAIRGNGKDGEASKFDAENTLFGAGNSITLGDMNDDNNEKFDEIPAFFSQSGISIVNCKFKLMQGSYTSRNGAMVLSGSDIEVFRGFLFAQNGIDGHRTSANESVYAETGNFNVSVGLESGGYKPEGKYLGRIYALEPTKLPDKFYLISDADDFVADAGRASIDSETVNRYILGEKR